MSFANGINCSCIELPEMILTYIYWRYVDWNLWSCWKYGLFCFIVVKIEKICLDSYICRFPLL